MYRIFDQHHWGESWITQHGPAVCLRVYSCTLSDYGWRNPDPVLMHPLLITVTHTYSHFFKSRGQSVRCKLNYTVDAGGYITKQKRHDLILQHDARSEPQEPEHKQNEYTCWGRATQDERHKPRSAFVTNISQRLWTEQQSLTYRSDVHVSACMHTRET